MSNWPGGIDRSHSNWTGSVPRSHRSYYGHWETKDDKQIPAHAWVGAAAVVALLFFVVPYVGAAAGF